MVLEHARLIALLVELGAEQTEHTGRTLLDHLRRTAALMDSWNAPEPWCTAALAHSAYGTDRFSRALLTERERQRLVDVVGDSTEALVWQFSVVDRDAFARGELIDRAGREMSVDDDTVRALAHLHLANAIEQLAAIGARPGLDRWKQRWSKWLIPPAAADHAALARGTLPLDVLNKRLQANAR